MTFAIEQRKPQQYAFEAPRWADVLAKAWLLTIAILYWLRTNQPKAEVYLLSRFDLARRRIGPIPPARWRLSYAFASLVFVVLWQETLIIIVGGLLNKGLGGICLG